MRKWLRKLGKVPHLFAKCTVVWCVANGSAACWYAMRIESRTAKEPAELLAVVLGFFGGELLLLTLKTVMERRG